MENGRVLTRQDEDRLYRLIVVSEREKTWRDLSKEALEGAIDTYRCNRENNLSRTRAVWNSLNAAVEGAGYMILVELYNAF